jgi:hypothetical protein
MLARRLNHVDTITQQDAAERALNKLARTYTTQMEALKRYRTGGQQKVTVEHVTVNDGGQAIVGHVTHGLGGRVVMKSNANLMHKAHNAPRCKAKAKTTGNQCRSPAVRGWQVCRMHGANGGAPTGYANGAWLHGDRSQAVDQNRRDLVALVKLAQVGVKTLPTKLRTK